MLVARSVGIAGFGFYSLAVAWGFVASQLADGGLHLLALREEVRVAGSFAAVGWRAKLLATVILLVGLGLIGPFYAANLPEIAVFWAIAASFVIYSLAEFGFSLLRAQGQLAREAGLIMANRLALLGLGTVLVGLTGWGLVGCALAHLLASVFTVGLTLRRVGINLANLSGSSAVMVWPVWKQAFPLGLGLLLSMLAFRIDVPLLAQFRPASEVGQYSAAYRLFEPVLMLPAAVLAGLFPILVRLAVSRPDFTRFSRRLVMGLAAAGAGIAVMLALLSAWLVIWFYGPVYQGSGLLLAVLAGAIPFMYANYALTHILIALHQERSNTLFFGIALVANIALNLLLIPLWGGLGAALSTVATEIVLSGLCLVRLGQGKNLAPARGFIKYGN